MTMISTLPTGRESTGRALPAAAAGYWSGRHVVITGGSSGIGLAVTRLAVAAGARVSVVALSDAALTDLALHPPAGPGALAVFPADVTDPRQLRDALDQARGQHDRIAAVIACAGIARPDYFDRLTDADFDRHMAVNYFGVLHLIRAALPDLHGADRDSITVISSMAGVVPCFGYGAYSPSKSAVHALCEVLRQELKPEGISVTAVLPPDVDTPQLAAESASKPPELAALNSGAPLSADAVARALLIGAARGRATVIPSLHSRVIRWLTGTAPGMIARFIDGVIARTRGGTAQSQRSSV